MIPLIKHQLNYTEKGERKKDMPNEIKVQKTIFQKIQEDVRLPMSKMNLKKSGLNKHLNYNYYELADFLPQATELLSKAGLCPVFNISTDNNGIEVASLTVYDGMASVSFVIPTASVPNMQGVFELGSKNTYCKRYLYMNLLELTDADVAEEINDGSKQTVEEKKATEKQVEMIKKLYDVENIARMLKYYQAESLEELTIKQASEAIARKKEA